MTGANGKDWVTEMATVGEYLFRLQDLSFFLGSSGERQNTHERIPSDGSMNIRTERVRLFSTQDFMVLTVGYTLIFSRYVAEQKKWTGGEHKDGDTCNHVNDSSTVGTEEEDICADCMSGSPSSGGSSQSANGKGKKKKGKNKDKKVFSSLLSDGCLECLYHVTQLSFVPYYVLSFFFWLM